MLKVGIIVEVRDRDGKPRPSQRWVHNLRKSRNDAEFEIVDIEVTNCHPR